MQTVVKLETGETQQSIGDDALDLAEKFLEAVSLEVPFEIQVLLVLGSCAIRALWRFNARCLPELHQ